MKYFILIGLFFFSACHIDGKLFNLNEKTIKQSIKKTKTSNITLPNTDFKKMSFDEFDLFLKEYSKNSGYPNINN